MYIKIEDVGKPDIIPISYDELQNQFPLKSLAQIGDLLDEGYYRIDERVVPKLSPYVSVDTVTYVLKEITEYTGSVEPVYTYKRESFDVIVKDLFERITQKRIEEETAGVTINGVPVNTTIEDQNRITSIIVNAPLAGIDMVRYKDANNVLSWKSLDEIKQISSIIARLVLGWFDAEATHYDAVTALTQQEKSEDEIFEDLMNYDISTGWPERHIVLPTP